MAESLTSRGWAALLADRNLIRQSFSGRATATGAVGWRFRGRADLPRQSMRRPHSSGCGTTATCTGQSGIGARVDTAAVLILRTHTLFQVDSEFWHATCNVPSRQQQPQRRKGMLMLATLTILDSSVAGRAAVVLPEFRGCSRQERAVDTANGRRLLCGELAARCLASGCSVAAMVKAALDVRKAGQCG